MIEVFNPDELSVCYNYPSNMSNSLWRQFNGTFACIKKIKSLSVLITGKYIFHEVCQNGESIIYFDVIDDRGKVNPIESSLILVVTSFHVSIFAVDEKGLKRVRRVSIGTDAVIVKIVNECPTSCPSRCLLRSSSH